MAAPNRATPSATVAGKCHVHEMFVHPKFVYMQSFGFPDEDQMRLSLIVYLDLTESKGWWNVTVVPCEILGKVLVAGHSSRTSPRELVLALNKEEGLTMKTFRALLAAVQEEYNTSSLLLAMVAGDSTTIYNRITDGLLPPEPPEAMEEKAKQQKRKVKRRYACFVRLAQLPENAPQYALTSASRRNQLNQDGGPVQQSASTSTSQTDTEGDAPIMNKSHSNTGNNEDNIPACSKKSRPTAMGNAIAGTSSKTYPDFENR